MSAQPVNSTAPDLINIEIDGKAMAVPKGSMIIQAADKAGIQIPRFCYHNKLPIAANCRMCMVEVEKAPKPQPACATPVMEGMKIHTQSQRALSAQRNVMEFLLINHPLDCPICDQGGECELQDLSMGYGRSVSRFSERKRVVADEDIGPLIATDMTRCIQCTRCVRFVSDIAGTYELGGLGRGEHLEIGTYIGKTIESELSGNVIDVCPVGALTNKPFRFRARAWELIARESIGYHDAMGSHLFLHTRRGEVLRTVPRDNEDINECWLSDRDRYSHQGLYASDRANAPQIKKNGVWQDVEWDEAIAFVAARLTSVAAEQIGTLVAPATSCEEGYLLGRLLADKQIINLDHRLRQLDFADGAVGVTFEMPIVEIEKANAFLLVGSNIRHELPLVNHRMRKATLRGARVFAVNPVAFDFNFNCEHTFLAGPQQLVNELLVLAKAASTEYGSLPTETALIDRLAGVTATEAARNAVKALREAASSAVVFGEIASQHPQASWLRALARFIAKATNSAFNEIPNGANAVGLARIGVMPRAAGLDAQAMLQQPRKLYVLYGCDPLDFCDSAQTLQALRQAESVIAFSAYASAAIREIAEVILPIGLLPEIDATLVNLEGTAQRVSAGAKLPNAARSGWRVLRALGAALNVSGFTFTEIEELQREIDSLLASAQPIAANGKFAPLAAAGAGLVRLATTGIYRSDAVLRRAGALQAHPLNRAACVCLHPNDAQAVGLDAGAPVQVSGGGAKVNLPLVLNPKLARGTAWIENAQMETALLPPTGASLSVTRV